MSVGKFLVMAPSTSTCSPSVTGGRMPGRATEACSARASLPRRCRWYSPAVRSLETQKKGSHRSGISTSPKCSTRRSRTLAPRVMATIGKVASPRGLVSTKALRMRQSSSSSLQPMATPAAMIAPMEAPPMKSMGMSVSCRALITPMWA